MKNFTRRNKYEILDLIFTHLKIYKCYYLICLAVVIFGAVFGVLTIQNTSVDIDIECLTDTLLLDFLKADSSWISFIFYKLIESIILFAIIFFCVFSVYLMPITLVILAYKSYNFFLNLTIMFKCLNVFGIFNTIIIILPAYIFSVILFVIFASIIMKLSVDFKKCHTCHVDDGMRKGLIKTILFLLLIRVVLLIYQVLMLSVFSNKFIIS